MTNEFMIRYKEGCFIIACHMDYGLCICEYEKEKGREEGREGRERGRECVVCDICVNRHVDT